MTHLRSLRYLSATVATLCALAWPAAAQPVIITYAGGGPDHLPALDTYLQSAGRLGLGSGGDVFILSAGRVLRLSPDGLMTRVAGTGINPEGNVDSGEPTPALEFGFPLALSGIAVDPGGDMYLSAGHRVYKMDAASGEITVVAGTGYWGFSGDGGPAVEAQVSIPNGLALDGAGGLAITDQQNHRIRRLDLATGIITTVAGTGATAGLGDGGPATSADLAFPRDVAFDAAGNLYIADSAHHRIRRVDAATGIISTYAGTGQPGFSGEGTPAHLASVTGPYGIDFDGMDRLYFSGNNRVQLIDSAGILRNVAGNGSTGGGGDGGPAKQASFSSGSILADAIGNVFIPDSLEGNIRYVDAATGIIQTIAGTGGPPDRICCPGTPATAIRLSSGEMAVDGAGDLFVTDRFADLIYRVDSSTGFIEVVGGGPGQAPGAAWDLVLAPGGGGILVMERGDPVLHIGGRIRTLDLDSGTASLLADFFYSLNGMASVPGGDAYALQLRGFVFDPATGRERYDPFGYEIYRVNTATGDVTTIPTGAFPAVDIDADAQGRLYLTGAAQIARLDPASGAVEVVAGTGMAGFGGDGGPAAAALLDGPTSVTVDPGGNIFIADRWNYRIRRVDAATRIITTFAGDGRLAVRGDGGPAVAASLGLIDEVYTDAEGNLFVDDTSSIRRIDRDSANSAPVADAGPDRTHACTFAAGTPVVLDGSASHDPDGDALLYGWEGLFPEGGGFVNGIGPVVTLPIGMSPILLLVSDGSDADSDEAEVTVTVEPVGLGPVMSGLTLEGQAPPAPSGPFRAGRPLLLELELLCDGMALDDADVSSPFISALAVNGMPLDLSQVDLTQGGQDPGLQFTSRGRAWSYHLRTRELIPGAYLMAVDLPDGRRILAAFTLEPGGPGPGGGAARRLRAPESPCGDPVIRDAGERSCVPRRGR